MIFVSYRRIQIFKIGISIRMKGIRILKKHIFFYKKPNSKILQDILFTNKYDTIYLNIKDLSGYAEIYLDTTGFIWK